MKIEYSSKFIRNFKKLPRDIRKKASKQEQLFKINIFDSSLRTHKLKGTLANCFAFSVDYSYRIIFYMDDNNNVVFLDIGDHSLYK